MAASCDFPHSTHYLICSSQYICFRFQCGDCGIQEHQLHSVGRWRSGQFDDMATWLNIVSSNRTELWRSATQYVFCLGQDQATLAPLLPEHPRTHLRRWQQWQVLVLNNISDFWQFFVLRERVGEARDELMRMLAEDELREAVSTKTLHLLCSINHLIPISGAADLRQQAGPAECNERRRDHWQVGSAQPEEQKLVHSGETETAPRSQVVTSVLFQATCATSGDGLYEGLDWLSNQLKNAAR